MRGGRPLRAVLLGGAAGSFVGPDALDTPLTFEGVRAIGATLGSGVVLVFDDSVDLTGLLRRIARFFRDESCGQCVPCRVGTVRQEELLARLARGAPLGSAERELALLDDIGAVDAGRLDLRTGPDGGRAPSRRRETRPDRRSRTGGAATVEPEPRMSRRCSCDGARGRSWSTSRSTARRSRVPEGATLLDACRQQGIDTPTLCYLENLTPVNVCRVCVVEVEGSRTLVPACSRKAETGMNVHTDSERVRTSRADGAGVPRLLRRPVAGRAGGPPLDGALRRRPGRYGAAGPAARRRGTGRGPARRARRGRRRAPPRRSPSR